MHRLERMSEAYRSLGAARGTLAWFAVLTLAEQGRDPGRIRPWP
jgi:hypothetical protein